MYTLNATENKWQQLQEPVDWKTLSDGSFRFEDGAKICLALEWESFSDILARLRVINLDLEVTEFQASLIFHLIGLSMYLTIAPPIKTAFRD
ncbi:hypothetical protein ACH5RR_033408 [Cinchona calisaya]|uniref:Uncharacterized protein n=1 Tax=Cinchona calisaya TaxID=153742 RepID=A0ABD2YKU6_9GENT